MYHFILLLYLFKAEYFQCDAKEYNCNVVVYENNPAHIDNCYSIIFKLNVLRYFLCSLTLTHYILEIYRNIE